MAFRPGVYARLSTEKPNPRGNNLDLKSTLEIVRTINREDALVAPAVARQARAIAQAADILARCLAQGGSVLFLGAGTSGRLGVLEAAECPPTFNTKPGQIQAMMAGGRGAVFASKEGAEDSASSGRMAVKKMGRGDVVVGVAASGITPFVRGALAQARRRGAQTILVTSNGRPLGQSAHITIAPQVGPEILAGSTRLKSGTAAKLVLNTLTTAAMIRLGKVYNQWMVDLKPTSRKLRLRAIRLVERLGQVDSKRAARLFDGSNSSVKLAVIRARLGLNLTQAQERLKNSNGNLRLVLKNL